MNEQANRSINPDLEAFIEVFQGRGWTLIDAGETDAEFQRPALRARSLWGAPDVGFFFFFLDFFFLFFFFFRWALGRLRGLHKAVDRLQIQVTDDGELIEKRELVRMSDYDRAIELNPGDTGVYYKRGISHHVLGQDELAIADFDRVVELNPRNTDGYFRRAVVRGSRGEVAEAIADLQQALSVAEDPDDRAEIEELMEDLRPR